jgi:hypothetical protein
MNYNNLTLTHRREERERLTGERRDDGAGSIELGGGVRDGRGGCEEIRGSGQSFYRWPGRGRRRWRAPARRACDSDDGA